MINLIKGDCLEEMDKLIAQGVKVDSIITDIPYGTTACKWDTIIPFDKMWERLNKLIKDNGAIVLFGSEPFSSALRMSNIKNYKYDWKYKKRIASNFASAKYQPMKHIEDIMIFTLKGKKTMYNPIMQKRSDSGNKRVKAGYVTNSEKGGDFIGNMQRTVTNATYDTNMKYPEDIQEFNNRAKGARGLHPTQKPVALMEYLIKTYTNEGETVLDFTMGSGSTGVACKNLNRDFIGIELDEKYFEIAEARIKDCKKELDILIK